MPPPTMALVEDAILRRARGPLALAGLDATTADGTNPDLAGPIRETLLELGYAPADLARPVDADLAAIPPGLYRQFFALLRIEVLEAALDQLRGLIEVQVGFNRFNLEDAAKGIETTLARLRAEYREQFLDGAGRPETACVESNYVMPRPVGWSWGGDPWGWDGSPPC